MGRSNCFIEAFKAWCADGKRGWFNIRLSRHGRFFHCSYTKFNGEMVNFLPPDDAPPPALLQPPLFNGVSINHDDAWRCHIQLREWGVSEDQLRSMSDKEIIAMCDQVADVRARMKGDY